jgi:conjugative relaxase-like TrwC/TraI family protein
MMRITPGSGAAQVLAYFFELLTQEGITPTLPESELAHWQGKLAERLGLSGTVSRMAFASMLGNMHPETGAPLTPRSKDGRRTGFEFGFSVPKSFTLMEEHDSRLLGAFVSSMRETMVLAEGLAATRVRRKGADHDRATGEMAWVEVIHRTGRPVNGVPDRQVHGHCFVLNATWDAKEGRYKALQLADVYAVAPVLEALFSSKLAGKVEALGYEVRTKGKFWEISGVPESAIEKHSRRTEQIERVAAEEGIVDPREKARLGAKTRDSKDSSVSLSELRTEWAARLTADEHMAIQKVYGEAEGRRAAGGNRPESVPDPSAARPSTESRSLTVSADELRGHARTEGDADGEQAKRQESTAGPGKADEQLPPLNAKEQVILSESIRKRAAVLFERAAVAPERELLDVGLRSVPGRVTLKDVHAEIAAQDILTRVIDDKAMVTTREATEDEKQLIDLAVAGKGRYKASAPISPREYPQLTAEQAEAVNVITSSSDLVTVVRGRAGVGKTALTKVAVEEICKQLGKSVCMLAPTAKAARGVLREEGHTHADTVAKFLVSDELQDRARWGVIFVDEAGLLGVKDAIRVQQKAASLGARVVFMGDDHQHKSVARGSPIETLMRHADVRVVTVDGIQRQKGAYKQVVEAMNRGEIGEAIRGLDKMQAIQTVSSEKLFGAAAADYVTTRAKGDKVLLVAPTHREGRAVTEEVRRILRESGELRGKTAYTSLSSRNLTVAEKGEASSYRAGDVVQFHRTVSSPGRGRFAPQEHWTVLGKDPFGNVMVSVGKFSIPQALPLRRAENWDVFEKRPTEFAAGDTVRITNGGRLHSRLDPALKLVMPSKQEPTHAVSRGEMHTVKRVTARGDLHLENGLVVDRDFGHVTHGYCVTSFAAQGVTVDRVIGVQSKFSGQAASFQQFNVTVTRGRKSVRIYTDDRESLIDSLAKKDGEATATGLLERGVDLDTYAATKAGERIHRQAMADRASTHNQHDDPHQRRGRSQ